MSPDVLAATYVLPTAQHRTVFYHYYFLYLFFFIRSPFFLSTIASAASATVDASSRRFRRPVHNFPCKILYIRRSLPSRSIPFTSRGESAARPVRRGPRRIYHTLRVQKAREKITVFRWRFFRFRGASASGTRRRRPSAKCGQAVRTMPVCRRSKAPSEPSCVASRPRRG